MSNEHKLNMTEYRLYEANDALQITNIMLTFESLIFGRKQIWTLETQA